MANPWARLRGILPQDTIQVGEVAADNANGTYYVELLGGGEVLVSGSGYTVGQSVYVRSGRIEAQAPSLSLTQIDV